MLAGYFCTTSPMGMLLVIVKVSSPSLQLRCVPHQSALWL
jgi:hypothetical protein